MLETVLGALSAEPQNQILASTRLAAVAHVPKIKSLTRRKEGLVTSNPKTRTTLQSNDNRVLGLCFGLPEPSS